MDTALTRRRAKQVLDGMGLDLVGWCTYHHGYWDICDCKHGPDSMGRFDMSAMPCMDTRGEWLCVQMASKHNTN